MVIVRAGGTYGCSILCYVRENKFLLYVTPPAISASVIAKVSVCRIGALTQYKAIKSLPGSDGRETKPTE